MWRALAWHLRLLGLPGEGKELRQAYLCLCDISGSDALYYGSLVLFDSQGQAALYIDRGGVLEYRDGRARLNIGESDVVFTHALPDFGWSLVTVLPGAYLTSRTQIAHLMLWMLGTLLVAAALVFFASR